jgi:tripartite-type tricarboxylate transporter receptor subunit TctC
MDAGTAQGPAFQGGNMPSKTISLAAILVAGLVAAATVPATAQTPEQFFKGKTITFYVGLSPGGGYDQNARLVARYFGKHVPGNPTVVVKNMPGGGGIVMTNYVANVADKDGLHIGAPQRGIPFEPLLGDASHAKYDPLKLQWIGSANADTSVAVVSKRVGVANVQDLKKKEVIVAGTGVRHRKRDGAVHPAQHSRLQIQGDRRLSWGQRDESRHAARRSGWPRHFLLDQPEAA